MLRVYKIAYNSEIVPYGKMKNGFKKRNKLWWYDTPFRSMYFAACILFAFRFHHAVLLSFPFDSLRQLLPSLKYMCHNVHKQIQYGDLPTKYVSNLCAHVVAAVVFFFPFSLLTL